MTSSQKNTIIPLYINSKDRLNVSDPTTNYTFVLRKSLRNISSLETSNVAIPKTYTNISVNNNSLILLFTVNHSETQMDISVESKTYTKTTLAAELEAQLNANDVTSTFALTWTVSYDTVTNKFAISVVYPNGVNTVLWGVNFILQQWLMS